MTPAPPISTMREPVPFRTDDRSGPLLGSAAQPTPSGFGVSSLIAGIVLGVAIGVGAATFLWGRHRRRPAPVRNTASTSAPVAAAPPTAADAAGVTPRQGRPGRTPPPGDADRGAAARDRHQPAPAAGTPPGALRRPRRQPGAATAVGNLLVRTSPDGGDGVHRRRPPRRDAAGRCASCRSARRRGARAARWLHDRGTRGRADARPARRGRWTCARRAPDAAAAAAAPLQPPRTLVRLVVESRPAGATVLLDGRPAGSTPVTVRGPGARVIHRAIELRRLSAHLDHRTRGRRRACARRPPR